MSEDKTKNDGKGKPEKSASSQDSATPAKSSSTPSASTPGGSTEASKSSADAGQQATTPRSAPSGERSAGQDTQPAQDTTKQQSKDKNVKGSQDSASSGSSAGRPSASKSAPTSASSSDSAGSQKASTSASSSTKTSSAKPARGSTPDSGASQGAGNGSGPAAGRAGGPGGGKGGAIGLVIAIVALIIALLAAAGAGWLWYRSQSTAAHLNSRVDTVEKGMQSSVQKVVMPRLSDMKERIQSLSSDVSGLSDRLDKRGKQVKQLQSKIRHVQTQNTKLADRLDGTHQRYTQQRVETLLEAANQRLRLYRDPASAQQALELADQAIQQAGDPRLFPVRRDIADEIATLKALPTPDIQGLSLKLSNLIQQVPSLPLATDVPSEYHKDDAAKDDGADTDSNTLSSIDMSRGWHHFVDSMGGALSSMVTVRRANGTQNAPALMAPDQAYFLTQNLQLQLRSAQLALLDHDTQAYQDNLSSARDWIKQYFDGDASSVQAALDTFNELSNVKLDWQTPDISASLSTLRNLMDGQQGNSGPAGNDAAEGENAANGGSEQ